MLINLCDRTVLFYHLPKNVPKKNGTRGTFITGEAMLINQFGRNGVILRNIM